jgi:hypothetical protein
MPGAVLQGEDPQQVARMQRIERDRSCSELPVRASARDPQELDAVTLPIAVITRAGERRRGDVWGVLLLGPEWLSFR